MWQQMIQDLRDAGYKWRKIGDAMGISPGAAHDLWTGRSAQPSGHAAIELTKLHKNLMRRSAKK
jgi:hypothetical protein